MSRARQRVPREHALRLTAPEVIALSIGDKTQTRLPLRPQEAGELVLRPPCAVGDRLWVQETWFCDDYTAGDLKLARSSYVGKPPSDKALIARWRERLYYRADGECCEQIGECQCATEGSPWRSSTGMPRWASRFVLEVTSLRLQRLQEMTEEDALAEGLTPIHVDPGLGWGPDVPALTKFWHLWKGLYGKRAPWGSNPQVWVITHKPLLLSQESGRGCIHQARPRRESGAVTGRSAA